MKGPLPTKTANTQQKNLNNLTPNIRVTVVFQV